MNWNDLVSKHALERAGVQDNALCYDMTNRRIVLRKSGAGIAVGEWDPEPFIVRHDNIRDPDHKVRRIYADNNRGIEYSGSPDQAAMLVLATGLEPLVSRSAFWLRSGKMIPVLITGDNLEQTREKTGFNEARRILKVRICSGPDRDEEQMCIARSVYLIVPMPSSDGYKKVSDFGTAPTSRKGPEPA